jgi:hypothetical protein
MCVSMYTQIKKKRFFLCDVCVSLCMCVCAYSDLCDVCVSMYTQIKKKRFFLCDVCVSLCMCVCILRSV